MNDAEVIAPGYPAVSVQVQLILVQLSQQAFARFARKRGNDVAKFVQIDPVDLAAWGNDGDNQTRRNAGDLACYVERVLLLACRCDDWLIQHDEVLEINPDGCLSVALGLLRDSEQAVKEETADRRQAG